MAADLIVERNKIEDPRPKITCDSLQLFTFLTQESPGRLVCLFFFFVVFFFLSLELRVKVFE